MEKTSSQPLQQPNKPKSTTQTQNKTKKPNAYRTCAHKTSTTTKKTQKTKVSKARKAAPFSQIRCPSNETFSQKIRLTRDYDVGTKNFVRAEKSKKSFGFLKFVFWITSLSISRGTYNNP
jgi:hypothetical protein